MVPSTPKAFAHVCGCEGHPAGPREAKGEDRSPGRGPTRGRSRCASWHPVAMSRDPPTAHLTCCHGAHHHRPLAAGHKAESVVGVALYRHLSESVRRQLPTFHIIATTLLRHHMAALQSGGAGCHAPYHGSPPCSPQALCNPEGSPAPPASCIAASTAGPSSLLGHPQPPILLCRAVLFSACLCHSTSS